MIITATVYSAAGEYIATLRMPDIENLMLNVNEDAGEQFVFGDFSERTYLKNGNVVTIPEPPGSGRHWHFDVVSEDWVDTRTPGDHQAALYNARRNASMDKSDLLITLAMAGILPAEDAEIAAAGTIPPTIQAVLDELPPEVFPPEAAMVARIKWRSDNVISRVNPVIVLAAAALGMTDEQLDEIFGVRLPS